MRLDTDNHALYRQEILAYGQTPSPEVLAQENGSLRDLVDALYCEVEDLESMVKQLNAALG